MSSSTFYLTLIGFAAVTFLVYKLVLTADGGDRPAGDGTDGRRSPPSSSASRVASAPAAPAPSPGTGDGGPSAPGGARHPPHARGAPSPSCLVRGVVPHKATRASARESAQQRGGDGGEEGGEDVAASNRRERARVFARMFAPSLAPSGTDGPSTGDRRVAGRPPARGSNVVVAIDRDDVKCTRLRRALYLLGTYYNLFVVVGCPEGGEESHSPGPTDGEAATRRRIGKIRDNLLDDEADGRHALTSDVVPRHRIVVSTRPKGRVAFARQLGGTGLVLDRDEEVAAELGRFGFRVLRYPAPGDGPSADGSSPLGRFLIP